MNNHNLHYNDKRTSAMQDILVQKLEIHEVTTHTITELLANASLTGGKLLEYAHEVCVGRRKL